MTAITVVDLSAGTCRNQDPDAMFPFPSDLSGITKAKAICARCPVKEQCDSWAWQHMPKDGIWAGLTYDDRQQLLIDQPA